jgi:polyisoprenoid-binding protein YceI
MKLLTFISFFFTSSLLAQNLVHVRATLIPNTGSFTAKSEKAKGRLVKSGNTYTADRISVFVTSFQTENQLRDKHFAEHIGGGKKQTHPRIDITELKAEKGEGQALLTLNGVTKPVKLKYEENKGFVEAKFDVSSSDFNLPKAQYLGIGVENNVSVTVKYFYELKK